MNFGKKKERKKPIFLFPGSFGEYTLLAQSFVRTRGQAYLDFDKTMPSPYYRYSMSTLNLTLGL